MSVISIQTKKIDDLSTVSTVDTSTAKIVVQNDGSTVAMTLDDTIDLFADGLSETVSELSDYLEEMSGYLIEYPLFLLDGTSATYKKVMRQWFLAQGIDTASPDAETLTALCDQWYALTRDQWSGYTEFYQPDVSAVTYGTKGGDNASLTCTPSTDTVEGTDDYAGLPLFACVDCNWEMYEDASGNAEILITAIDGITSNFKRYDTSVYVGVLQMSGYLYRSDSTDTYKIGYSAQPPAVSGAHPLPEAVKQDGTMREWVCHGKYGGAIVDSKITCCSGQFVTRYLSTANVITYKNNNGSNYSGYSVTDQSFLILMTMIKYGSLTLDGILDGCISSYSYQYYALVAEEGVNRVLVSSAAASYLIVGTYMFIGNYSTSTDRGYLYDISAGAEITAIETVTVDGTDYCAVYFDNIDAFDTAANGSATSGTTYISTAGWATGTTDSVLGNDGAMTSCTAKKYPIKLQGIEFETGNYEVCTDIRAYYYYDDDEIFYLEPYICSTAANQSTAITNYAASGCIVPADMTSSYQYYIIGHDVYDGILLVSEVGGSSSTYTCDTITFRNYEAGSFSYAAFGCLYDGSPAGVSCVGASRMVSSAYWGCSGRLSCNGNRGAWSA